ncbi:release factor glutamine methyltransferase [Lachnospiraceae bacterium]|nr:release factor glutamine methyltransferase [Lachnospiraceae bacterium]
MTYSEALRKSTEYLKEADDKDAATDASLLLMHVTGKDRTFFLAHGDEELTEREETLYQLLTEKRGGHVPLQHLTGTMNFMGLDFNVSENVLIPRIDTEFLVEEAMTFVEDGARVLDVCTGSGCILLSLMRYKNDIEGVGVDISDDALALSEKNAEELEVQNVRFIKSDLFENVEGKFDYILSNPPYIRTSDIDGLMEEVRLHEPHLALDGGEDGLDFYRRIAHEAKDYLESEGRLFFEIGFDEGDALRQILTEEGYKDIEVVKDYSGNERVVRCLKG